MSSPRDPCPDLGLERLGDRDGRRPAPLGEAVLAARALEAAASHGDYRAAYEALIDAVFTAPGVTEWLAGLRRAVAALLDGKTKLPLHLALYDAIRQAEASLGRR
jgi:hypothetical protein